METPSLTIFANFRINNEERYQRMKDSFKSFKDIGPQKWVINVRGSYKLKTILYLQEQLGEKLYPNLIESKRGWFHDTREMLSQIDTDFVFFWIEDHINLVETNKYAQILNDMKKNDVDHLIYSFWHDGELDKSMSRYIDGIPTDNFNIYRFNSENIDKIEKGRKHFFYIISVVGFFSRKMFCKVVNSDHPRLKRWPKETPFDFEKRSTAKDFIDFNLAIPTYELFANIDDDHGDEGYSLISRGLYKNKVSREKIQEIEYDNKISKFKYDHLIPKRILGILIIISRIFRRIRFTLKN